MKFIYFHSYSAPNYSTRVNYYSSASSLVRYNTLATGNANNDNQALLILKRFLMSNVGNEATTCTSTPISKFVCKLQKTSDKIEIILEQDSV